MEVSFRDKRVKQFFINKVREHGQLEPYQRLLTDKLNAKCIYSESKDANGEDRIYFEFHYELPRGRRDKNTCNFLKKELLDYLAKG